ncbi:hypothetical protein [Noviherbaspirillum aerium]|uniref:hypothetical protein n=1 Tax=Noviherbaspirillum aerium TaxID=2588497 RepID=UPI00124EA2E0|nr:hypothetical protein [Noviherbaspirillum aerium]
MKAGRRFHDAGHPRGKLAVADLRSSYIAEADITGPAPVPGIVKGMLKAGDTLVRNADYRGRRVRRTGIDTMMGEWRLPIRMMKPCMRAW